LISIPAATAGAEFATDQGLGKLFFCRTGSESGKFEVGLPSPMWQYAVGRGGAARVELGPICDRRHGFQAVSTTLSLTMGYIESLHAMAAPQSKISGPCGRGLKGGFGNSVLSWARPAGQPFGPNWRRLILGGVPRSRPPKIIRPALLTKAGRAVK